MRTKRFMMFITFIICAITSCGSAPTEQINSGCFEDEAAIVSPDGVLCIPVDDISFDADNLRTVN